MNKNNVKTNNLVDVCSDVMLHWVLCNVYTVTQKAVFTKLEQIVETYQNLKKYPRKKRKDAYFKNIENFRVECRKLFDIKCNDQKCIKDRRKSVGEANRRGSGILPQSNISTSSKSIISSMFVFKPFF